MNAIPLKEGIYWVGAIDWDLRNFHGYLTQRGSTYNAYLVIDDKITLIDTVKHYCRDEMFARISSVVDPARIDYIVVNHVEMDHSGSLPYVLEKAPRAEVVSNQKGLQGLAQHYDLQCSTRTIATDDTLSLGKRTLQFVCTPMVHWPDNMISYMPQERILFSNDSFGQHLASIERFDDQYPCDIIMEEAKKYYANIVMPYGTQATKELEKAQHFPVDMIAPSHGIIWRSHIDRIVEAYRNWAGNIQKEKAVVVYDTMWNSTAKMAAALMRAFEQRAIPASLCSLQTHHRSDIVTLLLDARYIAVGSPTLNKNMLPTVAAFCTYYRGLAPKGTPKKGIAFGSYGWGEMSVAQIREEFEKSNIDCIASLQHRYIPDTAACEEMTRSLYEELGAQQG
jgi:flavorubredoxin